MKNNIFNIFLILITAVSCQVKPKLLSEAEVVMCQELKTGEFKINHKLFGMKTSIIRNDSMQIEKTTLNNSSFEFSYNVKWLNDCTYELTPNPLFQNDIDLTGERIVVKITKVEGNILHYKVYKKGNRLRSRSREMIIVK